MIERPVPRASQDHIWRDLLVIFAVTLIVISGVYLTFGLMPAALLLCAELTGAIFFSIR